MEFREFSASAKKMRFLVVTNKAGRDVEILTMGVPKGM